jgi:hypothetical protein
MIYPDEDEVTFQYNPRGLPESIAGDISGSILASLNYLPSSQPESIVYGNGVRTTYDYDERLRMIRLLTRHVAQDGELLHFTYSFDSVSNIEGIDDQRPVSLVPLDDPRRNSQRFFYDDLYRLTLVQYNLPNPPDVNGGEIRYRYDRIDNLLAQISDMPQAENGVSGADLGTLTYGGDAGRMDRTGRGPDDPPGPHAVTGIESPSGFRALSTDPNGNFTEIDGLRCTWDFRDRLVAIEDDSMRADYRYDYSGRRVLKRVRWKPEPAQAPPTNPEPPSDASEGGNETAGLRSSGLR